MRLNAIPSTMPALVGTQAFWRWTGSGGMEENGPLAGYEMELEKTSTQETRRASPVAGLALGFGWTAKAFAGLCTSAPATRQLGRLRNILVEPKKPTSKGPGVGVFLHLRCS